MTVNRITNEAMQMHLYHRSSTHTHRQDHPFNLLYIGDCVDQKQRCFTSTSIHSVSNYAAAKQLMKARKNAGAAHFDVIVIDFSPLFESLNDFSCFLQRHKWCRDIPVLYHEGALSRNQVLELGKLSLVDDIVNIHSLGGELEQKARFLQKTKSFLRENAATATSKTSSKQHSSRQRMLHIVRRMLDVSIALLLFILLLPLMLVIMILIKLESQGPVIYCSKRAGQGCRIFDFYKFRTMRANAEKYMSVVESLNAYDRQRNKPLFFKALNDPRITRFGAFLRNTSLDELPQLINVIKGDMSLVGNRPLPLYEASTLTNDRWAERFMAPAGITGLWQVLKRGNKQMCLEERLNLDITYARQHNFSRDCWILANTPRALFQKMTM